MLSISHTLTGAFIATKVPPIVSIPLIFASHYLEDWVPHWDVGTGLSNGKRKKETAIILEIGELFISFGLVWLYWQQSQTQLMYAMFGAFIGLIPDFLEAPRNFLKWEPSFLRPINQFHNKFHHSTPKILWGLLPQIFLWIIIWFLR